MSAPSPDFATDNAPGLMTLTLDVKENLGVIVFPVEGPALMRFREPMTPLERRAVIAALKEAMHAIAGQS